MIMNHLIRNHLTLISNQNFDECFIKFKSFLSKDKATITVYFRTPMYFLIFLFLKHVKADITAEATAEAFAPADSDDETAAGACCHAGTED